MEAANWVGGGMQMTARCSPAGGLVEMALPPPFQGGDVIPGRVKAEVKLSEVRLPPPPSQEVQLGQLDSELEILNAALIKTLKNKRLLEAKLREKSRN